MFLQIYRNKLEWRSLPKCDNMGQTLFWDSLFKGKPKDLPLEMNRRAQRDMILGRAVIICRLSQQIIDKRADGRDESDTH